VEKKENGGVTHQVISQDLGKSLLLAILAHLLIHQLKNSEQQQQNYILYLQF
jgi:hypothetical protein